MRTPAVSPFDALVDGLRGRVPDAADWLAVVAMANRFLVTPTLFVALRNAGGVPADALDYLRFIHGRNAERNRRLRAQAAEAVAALNRVGLRPILLKGAGFLLTAPPDVLGARVLTDLDLLVPGEAIPEAAACLARLGYRPLPETGGGHAQAALARPWDVGTIDLHHRPPGSAAFHHRDRLEAGCVEIHAGDGWARLPSPAFRALHLIVHDLLQDKQVRTGDFDLRHLWDLHGLAALMDEGDWRDLAELMGAGHGRYALDLQVTALRRLFRTDAPLRPRHPTLCRLQHWRRRLQVDHPGLRNILKAAYRAVCKHPPAVARAFGAARSGRGEEGPSHR